MSEWIPVDERLPEKDTPVLATHKDFPFPIYVCYMISPVGRTYWTDFYYNYSTEDVLAWMPLPEPYEAKS